MNKRWLMPVSLALALPFAARGADVEDLTYAEIEGVPLQLDLYTIDDSPVPVPLVIWIHGGGWQAGDKSQFNPGAADRFYRDRGLALASINYRLTVDERFSERVFPAQIHDVKAAVRFLRAHAELYGYDPARIGLMGSSAGAHLAELAGLTNADTTLEGDVGEHLGASSDVQAIGAFFGPTDMELFGPDADDPDSGVSLLLGYPLGDILANLDNPDPPYPELVALMRSAGPVNHVDAGDPPIFIAHGDLDATVPVEQSRALHSLLLADGVEAVYVEVPGAPHQLGAMPIDQAIDFVHAALLAVCPADTDGSGTVDATDVAALLASWGTPGLGDLDADGVVGSSDLALLLAAWGDCG